MANYLCPKCKTIYDSEALRVLKCPDCKKWLAFDSQAEEEELTPEEVEINEWDELDNDTKAVVAASNRTTHAVRSLSLFFFTLLRWNLFGGGLIGIGLALNPFNSYLIFQTDRFAMVGPWLYIVGSLISFIGFFVALSRGARELNLSKP
jgi:uncharacterized protein YbaR (Trm112 family)